MSPFPDPELLEVTQSRLKIGGGLRSNVAVGTEGYHPDVVAGRERTGPLNCFAAWINERARIGGVGLVARLVIGAATVHMEPERSSNHHDHHGTPGGVTNAVIVMLP